MFNAEKSLKISLILTDISMVLLLAIVIILPFGVTWYVETMHRAQTLPATIMVTSYPCAPFVGLSLFSLRKIIKNAMSGKTVCEDTVKRLKTISVSTFIISVITLIAGRYYLPFYIVCGSFLFISVLVYTARAIVINANGEITQK